MATKELLQEFRTLQGDLAKTMARMDEVWWRLGEDGDQFDHSYPFGMSMDELTADVRIWKDETA